MQRRIFIPALSLVLLTILLLALVLPLASAPYPEIDTRATRTPSSSSQSARPTQSGAAQLTAQAVSTQVILTAQAASTQVMQTATAVAATLNAVATNGALVISKDDTSATVSYSFPEATVSAAVSAAFAAAGYPNASVDLVPGGMVITIPNMSYGAWTGTMVATFAIGVENGSLTVSLVSVTIAGHSVPSSAFDVLTESLTDVLNSIITASSSATVVSYTIDSIVFTDTQMTVTVTLDYTGDLPSVTPAFTPRPRGR
ncbi:MAG: hypothetical protein GC204_20795 [Chloroflexi bacterium]|nr:hypothetical protein [Chloroflexota bacterium]